MNRTACSPGLLGRARHYAPDVQWNEIDDRVEVTWFRRTGRLRSLMRVQDRNLTDALRELIALEADRSRRSAHGDDCPCEDCVIARVDRARELARRRNQP
jgi:hypothetical protein